MKYFSEPAAVIRSSRLTRATALTPAAGAGIRPQVSSSNGKARCLRGRTRKFCRRVAVMNRSRPLSSPWPPRNCFWNCCAAAALRIWAKRSAVGTYIRNCSLNCLLPAGIDPGRELEALFAGHLARQSGLHELDTRGLEAEEPVELG